MQYLSFYLKTCNAQYACRLPISQPLNLAVAMYFVVNA